MDHPAAAHDPSTGTLVVFCRRPRPGVGKQRLARDLGMAQAREAAELLLGAALEDAAAWPGAVILSPADPADAAWAARLLPGRGSVLPQPAGNLGERLMAVARQARAAGHPCLHFIGSDAPLLGPDFYAAARRSLAHHDVVLAPADDGGVTLMASRVPWPDLRDLPWSTPDLGRALAARCRESGLRVGEIPGLYDVDEAGQLARLARDLAADPRPARQRLCQWLGALGY